MVLGQDVLVASGISGEGVDELRHYADDNATIALLGASFAFAADTKPAAPAGKKGRCCVKAETAGATCTHPCCVESAKAGKNCEKCGGTNVAATKK
mgnify:CR=1 FL=1